jgi:hypothetical protein
MPGPDRRTFLQSTGLTAAAAALAGFGPGPAAAAATGPFTPAGGPPQWKGNTHSHINQGGLAVDPYGHLPRSTGRQVLDRYRLHGYNFAVAQINLNVFSPNTDLAAEMNRPGQFLVIPSEEDSRLQGLHADQIAADSIYDTLSLFNTRPVPQEPIPGSDGIAPDNATATQVYIATREAIESVGGLASLAHPLLTYSGTVEVMLATRPRRRLSFFEVWNGEPGIPQNGGGGRPSTDQLWDAMLAAGHKVYATAGDDGFPDYPIDAVRPGSINWNAGRAWIMVWAPELSLAALKHAMYRGHFYATTGVVATDYQVRGGRISITLPKADNSFHWSDADHNPTLFRTLFINQDGIAKPVKVDESLTPSYTAKKSDKYVRVKVLSSCNNEVAWFQPVFRH